VAAAYYVDSSGLVKRYVREDGTGWVRRLTRRNPSTVIYIARITAVEVTSAVARRRKGKTLTSAKASMTQMFIPDRRQSGNARRTGQGDDRGLWDQRRFCTDLRSFGALSGSRSA
jgi:hypothetical protein